MTPEFAAFVKWCRLVLEQMTPEAAVESIGRYLDEITGKEPQ